MSELRETLIRTIESIEDLPVLGKGLLETQALFRAAELDASAISKIIEKDPWLASRLLKLTNSVFYGGRYGEIGSLRQAVTRLGIDEVCRIALAFKAVHIFPKLSPVIDPGAFWHHSIAVAMVTRSIAEQARKRAFDPAEGYVAGLLHDAGIVILDRYCNAVYKKVHEALPESGQTLFMTEQALLGIDHAEVGARVLERWKLPESVVNAVASHHEPDRSKPGFRGLAQLVHLADFACSALGVGEPGDLLPQNFSHGAWHDLDMDTDRIQKIVSDVEEEIKRTKVLFNMI